MSAKTKTLIAERDAAIKMLAEWAVSVEQKGSEWGCLNDRYRYVMYEDNVLRELLNAAIAQARVTNATSRQRETEPETDAKS